MLIELGDVAAWPAGAVEVVDRWVAGDKSLDQIKPEDEDAFRTLFIGVRVRAYHFARYLPHELDAVRRDGLRPATKDLFDERVNSAVESGDISTAMRDHLLSAHTLSKGHDTSDAKGRAGKICFALPRSYFDSQSGSADYGMGGFLMWWGGEAVFIACNDDEKEQLKIGRPTIVVCDFEVTEWLKQRLPVRLLRVCIEIRQRVKDASTQIDWDESIPFASIQAIWHPGDPEFDAFKNLPRA